MRDLEGKKAAREAFQGCPFKIGFEQVQLVGEEGEDVQSGQRDLGAGGKLRQLCVCVCVLCFCVCMRKVGKE